MKKRAYFKQFYQQFVTFEYKTWRIYGILIGLTFILVLFMKFMQVGPTTVGPRSPTGAIDSPKVPK